jgi:tripartite-type tricarboxylate transporter receptor subunit TctC
MKNILLALVASLLPAVAAAQYPTKPVRVVIHFPAGGSTDYVARVLSQGLTESMGQPFVVENRTGADGAIAASVVMQSPPDGHTLFIATNTAMAQVPYMKKNPPYDPLKDFTPVSLVGRYTFLLVVTPKLGVNSFNEFVAYAKKNPGKINFSTYSGASQLTYAQIVKNAGVDMLRVPYKGEAPSVTDILGGQIHAVFATPTSSLAHIRDGRLKALAVTLPQRWPLLPEVPTTVEAGMPPITVEFFAALYGPAGMSPAIAQRVSQELNKIIARPAVREQIDKQGFALAGSTPEELGAFTKRQIGTWAQGFKEAGIQPE